MRSARLLVALVFAAACGAESASEAVPAWSLEEDLRIGSLDDAETSLTMVTNIETGPGGDIYVAQPLDRQIRVFAPDGTARGIIGRPGEGPGEFGSVMALGWRADTLFVADGGNRRVSFFNADGTFLVDISWLNMQTPRPELQPNVPGILLDDGTAILQYRSSADAVVRGDVEARPWVRVDRTAILLDTVWDAPVGGNTFTITIGRTGQLFTGQPWLTDPIFLPSPDGDPLYVVNPLPPNDADATFTVLRVTSTGDTLWTRSLAFDRIPITAERADSARAVMEESLEGFRERIGMAPSELRSKVAEATRLPPVVPPVRRGFVATDGSLWLQREDRPGSWTVVGTDGATRAHVVVPDGIQLMHVDGDAVYGTVTDEFDVPYVVRLRISGESQ